MGYRRKLEELGRETRTDIYGNIHAAAKIFVSAKIDQPGQLLRFAEAAIEVAYRLREFEPLLGDTQEIMMLSQAIASCFYWGIDVTGPRQGRGVVTRAPESESDMDVPGLPECLPIGQEGKIYRINAPKKILAGMDKLILKGESDFPGNYVLALCRIADPLFRPGENQGESVRKKIRALYAFHKLEVPKTL